jgi:hypothetical protein
LDKACWRVGNGWIVNVGSGFLTACNASCMGLDVCLPEIFFTAPQSYKNDKMTVCNIERNNFFLKNKDKFTISHTYKLRNTNKILITNTKPKFLFMNKKHNQKLSQKDIPHTHQTLSSKIETCLQPTANPGTLESQGHPSCN